jgi:hypothetical protein
MVPIDRRLPKLDVTSDQTARTVYVSPPAENARGEGPCTTASFKEIAPPF